MRTIKIPGCGYKVFEAIRDAYNNIVPFALLRDSYSKATNTAVFTVWGSEYVPKCLKEYEMVPPGHKERIEQLEQLIGKETGLDFYN